MEQDPKTHSVSLFFTAREELRCRLSLICSSTVLCKPDDEPYVLVCLGNRLQLGDNFRSDVEIQ